MKTGQFSAEQLRRVMSISSCNCIREIIPLNNAPTSDSIILQQNQKKAEEKRACFPWRSSGKVSKRVRVKKKKRSLT